MTVYYLSSVDGVDTTGAGKGESWDEAWATFEYAVETGIGSTAGGPHVLLVDSAHSESVGATYTVTFAQDLRVISVNRASSNAPLAGASIGVQATNYRVDFAGAYDVYVYGLNVYNGTNATAAAYIFANFTDGGHFEFESCTFWLRGSNSTSTALVLGSAGGSATGNTYTKLKNCTIKFGQVTHGIQIRGQGFIELEGCTLDSGGTAPTTLFIPSTNNGTIVRCEGCDFGFATTNLVGDAVGLGTLHYTFTNCEIGASTVMVAPTSVLNKGQTSVWMFNCASGDTHYSFYHGDAFGETYATDDVYAADGARFDGLRRLSWQIVTRANNCSYYTPYVSPWMDQYNNKIGVSFTPYLECYRAGNASAYTDAEVWSEVSYQGNSNSTQSKIASDRVTPLASATAQTASSKVVQDWTGSSAPAAFFKLGPSDAITALESGHIRARICVGLAGATVYVDPLIRGVP